MLETRWRDPGSPGRQRGGGTTRSTMWGPGSALQLRKSCCSVATRVTTQQQSPASPTCPFKYNIWARMTPHSPAQRYLSTRGGSYDVGPSFTRRQPMGAAMSLHAPGAHAEKFVSSFPSKM
jgi:hypothetical protein